MSKYLGSYMGKKDDINSSAKGVWNIFHHLYRKYIGQWPVGVTDVSATGGDIADALQPGNGFIYHTFSTPGNFTVLDTNTPTATIEILVVAGGGGGGDSNPGNGGGGGGAGGIVYHTSWPVPAGPYPIVYPVTVGGGGPGAPTTEASGTNGSDSLFGPPVARLTAKGGGGGGFYTTGGNPGGCGGGGGGAGTAGGTATQGSQPQPGVAPGFTNYGFAGGASGPGNPGDGGSGGGTDGAGQNAGQGGNGRAFPGFEYPIVGLSPIQTVANSPSNNQYGGGGGGEDYSVNPPFISGQGGGGGTKPPTYPPPQTAAPLYAGVNGTGGGGASSSDVPGAEVAAGKGGDGIVIIRYQ